MPKEVRRLVFAHQETTEAVLYYAKKFNITLPMGRIIRVKYASDAPIETHALQSFNSTILTDYNVSPKSGSVIITFFDENTFEHKFYNFTTEMVSGALIEYCLRHKILLPKKALKTLDVTDFNVCLDITYEHDDAIETGGLSFEE